MSHEEYPRFHRLKAVCCTAEILNFGIPSRAPVNLVNTALQSEWELSRDGYWYCREHKATPGIPSTAEGRLARIAEAHQKDVFEGGSTSGLCVDCEYVWPCPTYVWATTPRDLLATWDPEDDEPADTP